MTTTPHLDTDEHVELGAPFATPLDAGQTASLREAFTPNPRRDIVQARQLAALRIEALDAQIARLQHQRRLAATHLAHLGSD